MYLFYLTFLLSLPFAAENLEVSSFKPSMMEGNFRSCLKGICREVSKVHFIENQCFRNNKELGIYYFVNDLLHLGQLNTEYEILETNCTVSEKDIIKTDDIGLYNLINDRYDIAYLVTLLAAKIIIVVLACILYKNKPKIKIDKKHSIAGMPFRPVTLPFRQPTFDTKLSTIQEHYLSAPPFMPTNESHSYEPATERTRSDTRASLLSSTHMPITEIYPSFTEMRTTLNLEKQSASHFIF